LEELMLDIMYEIPSIKDVKEIVVTERDVLNKRIHLSSIRKAV
jgi:ATP-dependent protease Clp ATPase subunit